MTELEALQIAKMYLYSPKGLTLTKEDISAALKVAKLSPEIRVLSRFARSVTRRRRKGTLD